MPAKMPVAVLALLCLVLAAGGVTVNARAESSTDGIAPTTANGDTGTAQQAILLVSINKRELGHYFAVLDNGDVLLDSAFLQSARLRREHWPQGEQPAVSLTALLGAGSWQLDETTAALNLQVNPAWLEAQHFQGEETRQPGIRQVTAAPFSGYLNYALVGQDNDGETTTRLPWDFGIHARQWLLHSQFSEDLDNKARERLQSTLSRELPGSGARLTLGDVLPRSGGFGGVNLLGGIGLERAWDISPDEKRHAGLSTTVLVDTPSTIEVLRNNQVIRRLNVEAGLVTLEDLVTQSGSGDVQLQITDIQGNRRIIDLPYFLSSRTLKPGKTDYAWFAGMPRDSDHTADEYADRPALIGWQRWGVTSSFTAGLHAQADEETWNTGPTFDATLGIDTETSMLLAFSEQDGHEGHGGRADVTLRLLPTLRLQASSELFSREFSTVGRDYDADKVREGYRGVLSIDTAGRRHSFSMSATSRRWWQDDPYKAYSLGWHRQLGHQLSLTASLDLIENDDDQFNLMLLYAPTRKPRGLSSLMVRHEQPVNDSSAEPLTWASVQSSMPRGPGYWYGAEASGQEGDLGLRGSVGANLRHATATASVTTDEDITSSRASIAGGIGFVDGRVLPGRPIRDSFAIVEAGLHGIPVFAGGGSSRIGTTSSHRRVLANDLSSYTRNEIAIDTTAVPIDYTLADNIAKQGIKGEGRRWGALVSFGMSRLTASEGYLLDPEGKPLEHLQVAVAGGPDGDMQSVTGDKGYFYLENLPPGTYRIRALLKDGSCSGSLVVREESNQIIQSQGNVACIPGD